MTISTPGPRRRLAWGAAAALAAVPAFSPVAYPPLRLGAGACHITAGASPADIRFEPGAPEWGDAP
ncbi:hypothetical protein [Methylorubrum thiocyanatum]|uniref:hypothetical protein n=1 Tax=Methylorubrum thiocyanatum TaxID=47958 RepID=UPI0035C829FD